MNAIVYNTTRDVSSWFTGFIRKLSRQIDKIGYARAASELARLGHIDAAKKCIEQMNKL